MAQTWATPRLLIRRFRADDWRDLYELQGDPEATRFIGGVWSEERTRDTLNVIIANYDSREFEWFAVADRATDAVLGVCWLGPLREKWCDAVGLTPPQIELGYRYARRYWGQGYATEAAAAMLRRGFEELGLERIVAVVDVCNAASERVLQKIGMLRCGAGEHDGLTIACYGLDRDAFSACKSRPTPD